MFCNHKSELIFNLHYIAEFFPSISDVIIHPIVNNKQKSSSKLSNVFKQNIFQLFNMVSRIEMYSTDKQGKVQYPMNKKSLLELIKPLQREHDNVIAVIINATHKYNTGKDKKEIIPEHVDNSWVYKLWERYGISIEKKFMKHNLEIEFIESNDGTKHRLRQDCFRIFRTSNDEKNTKSNYRTIDLSNCDEVNIEVD
eukprot:428631_1